MASADRHTIERIVRDVLVERYGGVVASGPVSKLVVNISARHAHLSDEHVETLFGAGATLTKMRDLYQPGEFAAEQTVTIIGPRRRMIPNLRVLGPTRKRTQVELAFTDAIGLGIEVPVRKSGEHHDTPGALLIGPAGHVQLDGGVIRAERHAHLSPADARFYGFADGQYVKLRVTGTCTTTFERVLVRVGEGLKLEVHLDTDEGNACDLPNAERVELLA